VEVGRKPGVLSFESAKLRGMRKRLLEQENETLRRAAANLLNGNLPK